MTMKLSADPCHLQIERSSKLIQLSLFAFLCACYLLFSYFLFLLVFMLLLDLLGCFHLHKVEMLVSNLFFLIFFHHSLFWETQILLNFNILYFFNQFVSLHFFIVIIPSNYLIYKILRFTKNSNYLFLFLLWFSLFNFKK